MRLRNIPGAKEAVMESAFVVQRPQEKKGGWAQVYPQTGPIHIEVGMGKGQFLMELARRNPQVNYLGIEMYDSVLLRALQRMAEIDESTESIVYEGRCQVAAGDLSERRGGKDISEFFRPVAKGTSCETAPHVSGISEQI